MVYHYFLDNPIKEKQASQLLKSYKSLLLRQIDFSEIILKTINLKYII